MAPPRKKRESRLRVEEKLHPLLQFRVRQQIFNKVQARPGISAIQLRRELDASWGTLAYHLRRMERAGLIARRPGQRLYPAEVGARDAAQRRAAEGIDADAPFTETKKVRLGPRAAKWLEETARREEKNESDILREGLLLAERIRARGAALEDLLEFVDDGAPDKETFELR